MRDISLYVHIPFCMRRCPYCTFYHVPHVNDYETAFVEALKRELASASETIGEPFRCPTVFVGGGTPSVLNDRSLDQIFEAIRAHLPDAGDVEITIEANPEDVTVDLLAGLRARGVNRLSLGVQSMHPGGLSLLGRCTREANARAIDLVGSHFDNFSIDVLLGIPGGTLADLEKTMERLTDYAPPHYAVYCLEPGGVMTAGVEDFFDGVDPERAAEEYLYVCAVLAETGYGHYEVSNFARAGFESRHNQAYWKGAEYVGLGPGAHSYLAGERFYNEPSIERYLSDSTGVALRCIEPRDDRERAIERRMLALRTSDGLPLDQVEGRASAVDDLVTSDLAVIVDDRLVLTDKGFLLLDEIVLRLTPG
jgi:oxygen-independent coproporphyrinogen-3 oxidase